MRRPAFISLAAMAILIMGCGASGGSTVRSARLTGVYRVQGQGDTLHVGVETEGVCLGNQRNPNLESIEIDEGPGGKAVITATVREFPVRGNSCAGLGLGYERPIHTSRPVRQLTIYDGSESPPRRLGVPVITRAKFRQQTRVARHNARIDRRDREADQSH